MPELPEVEQYRVLLEAHGLHRRIAGVSADDGWYLKRGLDHHRVAEVLEGRALGAARRRGKLLVADIVGAGGGAGPPPGGGAGPPPAGDAGAPARTLGLRFGMSGRLLVDGRSAIDRLLYAPVAPEERWDRFVVHFADGGDLRMHDPRRLGGVELDPDLTRLGPDALGASLAEVRAACAGGHEALKARLLDQSRLAGVGNLVADELLWRAGLSPLRPSSSLDDGDVRILHRRLGATLRMLIRRGGSHTGDLMAARRPGGRCPQDGAALGRSTVGGRTTWWCPEHQH